MTDTKINAVGQPLLRWTKSEEEDEKFRDEVENSLNEKVNKREISVQFRDVLLEDSFPFDGSLTGDPRVLLRYLEEMYDIDNGVSLHKIIEFADKELKKD